MALVVPNEGVAYLVGFLPVGDDQFAHLHLYCNDYTPDRSSTLADFVRAVGNEGDPVVLENPDLMPVGPPQEGWELSWPDAIFDQTVTVPNQKVYGYYVVKEGELVIWAERFSTPKSWAIPGQRFKVAPRLRVFSLNPPEE